MPRPLLALLILLAGCASNDSAHDAPAPRRPNILFAIADDVSFPHMGAYGTDWVSTPAFDRVAREGLLFMNAYTPNAKCAPSRSCILTGRNSWQLDAAANHWPNFPAEYTTFAEVLAANGYYVGHTAKGWGPGNPGTTSTGEPRRLVGPAYNDHQLEPPTEAISKNDYAANFRDFLDQSRTGTDDTHPFFFWYGSLEPHRGYAYGSGVELSERRPEDIDRVPPYWPDTDTVRNDMLDYALELEHFDRHLGRMLDELERRGELENTLVVVTADNGMPFPRVKGQAYEPSNHLPLAMMWADEIVRPGRKVEELVSFIDFAPTFLALAGIDYDEGGMQPSPGLNLAPLLADTLNGDWREHVLIGKERHDVGRPGDAGYPIRGIVTAGGELYLRNYAPDRWPAGNPETGYLNADGSATKTQILNLRRRGEHAHYWQLNFGKRPAEELYDIADDPYCLENLADNPDRAPTLAALHERMEGYLRREDDPRILGGGRAAFDTFPYVGKEAGFYERYMAGEEIEAGWVEGSDFEGD